MCSSDLLETRPPFTEVDLARQPRAHHPLQRAVDRGTPDPRVLATHGVVQVIGAEMALLPQKRTEDEIALGRALAAHRAEIRQIGE